MILSGMSSLVKNTLFELYAKAACEKTFQFDITVVADKWEQALQSI